MFRKKKKVTVWERDIFDRDDSENRCFGEGPQGFVQAGIPEFFRYCGFHASTKQPFQSTPAEYSFQITAVQKNKSIKLDFRKSRGR